MARGDQGRATRTSTVAVYWNLLHYWVDLLLLQILIFSIFRCISFIARTDIINITILFHDDLASFFVNIDGEFPFSKKNNVFAFQIVVVQEFLLEL